MLSFILNCYFCLLKKLAAISLAILVLFNITGYRLFILYEQYNTDKNFVAQIDKENYTNKELITIKVPLHLPYLTNSNEFERVNGEINFEGHIYKYVKRKITNDTMVLLCLQHAEKATLEQQANIYFGKINDLPSNTNTKTSSTNLFKQMLSEYDEYNVQYVISAALLSYDFNLYKNTVNLYHFIAFRDKPPKYFV